MLFAVHYGDRAAFDLAWQWTQRNLQVRDDALMAWRWDPKGGVTDKNDAADGDILIAWRSRAPARSGSSPTMPRRASASRRTSASG